MRTPVEPLSFAGKRKRHTKLSSLEEIEITYQWQFMVAGLAVDAATSLTGGGYLFG